MKNIFRGLALYLLGTGMFFLLILLAYSLVFTQVTANPDKLKQILRDSGVYAKIPAVIYDDSVQSGSTASLSLPLQDPAVRSAALDAFDPVYLQTGIESAIDGAYDWLDGKTTQPEFSVDLQAAKNEFATKLSDQAANRLQTLPICTSAQLRQITDVDSLFDLPCLPPRTDINTLKMEFANSVAGSQDFLKEPKITPETLKDEDGKSVFDDYRNLPQTFQTAKILPYILLLTIAFVAAGILLLSPGRSAGLLRLSKLLLIGAVFAVFAPTAINYLMDILLKTSSQDTVAAQLVTPVVDKFGQASATVYYIMGAIYGLLALGTFLLSRKIGNQTKEKLK